MTDELSQPMVRTLRLLATADCPISKLTDAGARTVSALTVKSLVKRRLVIVRTLGMAQITAAGTAALAAAVAANPISFAPKPTRRPVAGERVVVPAGTMMYEPAVKVAGRPPPNRWNERGRSDKEETILVVAVIMPTGDNAKVKLLLRQKNLAMVACDFDDITAVL